MHVQDAVLTLGSEILSFLLERQVNEAEPQFALTAMPIPVGEYAEYRGQTGDLYAQKFGARVQKAIAGLRRHGLEDAMLTSLSKGSTDPQIDADVANRLIALGQKLSE